MNMNKIQVFKRPGPGALKIEYMRCDKGVQGSPSQW